MIKLFNKSLLIISVIFIVVLLISFGISSLADYAGCDHVRKIGVANCLLFGLDVSQLISSANALGLLLTMILVAVMFPAWLLWVLVFGIIKIFTYLKKKKKKKKIKEE